MRKILIAIISLSVLFVNCKGNKKSETEKEMLETKSKAKEGVVEENPNTVSKAVCLLDKLSVRATPTQKGKWITSMSLGETITYTGEKTIDSVSKKEYYKVKLVDDKEGWARADFIVVDGEVGVMQEETNIYKRPDLLTKTDRKYSPMDIIAVLKNQGEWIQVKGKRAKGKYIEDGWVKSSNISNSSVDIATAKFVTAALSKDTMDERIKSLEEILTNSDISSSTFISVIKEIINDLKEKNQLKENIDSSELKEEENK